MNQKNDHSFSFLTYDIAKKAITLASKEKVNSIIIYNQLDQIVHKHKNCCNTTDTTISANTFAKERYYLKANCYVPLKFVKN